VPTGRGQSCQCADGDFLAAQASRIISLAADQGLALPHFASICRSRLHLPQVVLTAADTCPRVPRGKSGVRQLRINGKAFARGSAEGSCSAVKSVSAISPPRTGEFNCRRCHSRLSLCLTCRGHGTVIQGSIDVGYSEVDCSSCRGTGKVCPNHGAAWIHGDERQSRRRDADEP